MTLATERTHLSVPPRLGALLAEVADTADLETALVKVVRDYIELKLTFLDARAAEFEEKWRMGFAEFAAARDAGRLGVDAHAYPVESDFWEWEEAETLRQHYRALHAQWM